MLGDDQSAGDDDPDSNGARSRRDLVTVCLLDVPVGLWGRADDEAKDLMREFTLIVLGQARDEPDSPGRLLELIEELQQTYGAFGSEQTEQLERARNDGQDTIDRLEYRLPAGAQADIRRLGDILNEADEYCRRGKHLLSLASSVAARAFRGWFLEEMCNQLGGHEPTPWPKSSYAATATSTAGGGGAGGMLTSGRDTRPGRDNGPREGGGPMTDLTRGYETEPVAFTITRDPEDGGAGSVPVLRLGGEMDLRAATELRGALLQALTDGGGSVLLDLTELTFMDSTIISVLIMARKRAETASGEVRLRNVAGRIQRILSITGIDSLFPVDSGAGAPQPRA
ncbi:MAG: STAS domain-containing protein [Acidimicrobiales bacterium]